MRTTICICYVKSPFLSKTSQLLFDSIELEYLLRNRCNVTPSYVYDIWFFVFATFFPQYISGPAVVVGVTLYVLSISSLSEVEMVQK